LGLQATYITINTGGLLHRRFTLTIYEERIQKQSSFIAALAAVALKYKKAFGFFVVNVTKLLSLQNGGLFSVALSLALLRPFVKWNPVLR